METVNRIAARLCGWFMRPFETASPWPGLLAASLLIAVLALLAFKYGTRQSALRRARNRMIARVLELQIFRDDLAGIFGAFGRILTATARYLGHTLVPLLILVLPLAILLSHFACWFEYRPLRPGETTLLTVRLDEAESVADVSASVRGFQGLEIDQDVFRGAASGELAWRFRAVENQSGQVELNIAGERIVKSLTISQRVRAVSSRRVRNGFWSGLLHPLEPALPRASHAVLVEVGYPRREVRLGTLEVNWLVALFLASMVFGLILKRPMRVEF